MILLYKLGVRLYYVAATVAALWSSKAKKWVRGQQQTLPDGIQKSVWFHFASLGEFEQGRTVLEALREQYADLCFVVTFFSPSGYEIRKNTPLADLVLYLPLDTPRNASAFIERIKPRAA
ncbi:MAG: 3-deoxy-D-manno-octulosonic acid transferase, partial [Mucilaginibacter polytrichastri]|nr:3-deoxy-D-manno-octulosonic acid transferase [Mucilaginibacter polytrichastri]